MLARKLLLLSLLLPISALRDPLVLIVKVCKRDFLSSFFFFFFFFSSSPPSLPLSFIPFFFFFFLFLLLTFFLLYLFPTFLEYQTLDTEIGEVAKFSKKTILVFDNTVSVAVGGLDGYEQQEVAPDVDVQIDAAPFADSEYNVLLSKGAEANVAIIDMSQSVNSKIVLSIDPSKSFGIWKVNGM